MMLIGFPLIFNLKEQFVNQSTILNSNPSISDTEQETFHPPLKLLTAMRLVILQFQMYVIRSYMKMKNGITDIICYNINPNV